MIRPSAIRLPSATEHYVNASAGFRVRESGFNCVSPVGASIYCSPHPAALQIDSPPGSRSFAFRFRAREDFHANSLIWN